MVQTTTVRIPFKLKQEVMELVNEGYYKNLSDAIVSGLRREAKECRPSPSTLTLREANSRMWEDYMKKAKGSESKAIGLYLADLKKIEKSSTFKKLAGH